MTARQWEILQLLANGHDTAFIALHLNISQRTVKNDVAFICHEWGARNRTHAVAIAIRRGLI